MTLTNKIHIIYCNLYMIFHFGIKNTGNLIINSKYYNIFIKIEELSQDMLSFLNSSENYIHFTNDEQNLLPNKKTNICKKLTIKNLKPNAKYEFHMNIYSSCHGKISEQPLKINILTTEYKEKDFLSLLKNEDLNFDISNKKVIFEYLEEINIIGENINKDKIINKKKFKINTYLYNNKKGIIENKEEDWDNIDNYVVINKDYIENKKSKLYETYKFLEKNDKINIEDIICSCAGNFQVMYKVIEKLKNN